MHNKIKGTIGELKVITDLISQGYTVYKEVGDNSSVDLIVLVKNVPIKVQIKARTCTKTKTIVLENKRSAKNYRNKYNPHDVDVFALYSIDNDAILYISAIEFFKNSTGMSFRFNESKNKQLKNIHLSTDYLQFERALRDYTPRTLTFSDEGEEIVQTETSIDG